MHGSIVLFFISIIFKKKSMQLFVTTSSGGFSLLLLCSIDVLKYYVIFSTDDVLFSYFCVQKALG